MLQKISAPIYRGLVMMRHPEAIKLRRKGIDYDHFRAYSKPWLRALEIRTVLDVGANTGQFARLMHEVLPDARIYSFEPLPECYEVLRQALEPDARFHPLQMAVGEVNTTLNFYRSIHTPSSSFLKMTSLHQAAFPESLEGQEEKAIRVESKRLDDAVEELVMEDNVLLKIDVQGYEARVIAGAPQTLKRVKAVLIETSFVELYESQPLFDEIYRLLCDAGYVFRGNLQQMTHPSTGEIVQADSIFLRAE